MFNTYLFNTQTFNNIDTSIIFQPQDDITYNGYGLSNSNIIISKIDFDNGYSVDSETFNNPLTDLGGELNYFFRQKIVNIEGTLKADTYEELNNKIDELKKVLGQNNKDLDIKVNGTIRRAKASCINLNSLFQRETYNITFIKFNIQFRLISEFSRELTRQTQDIIGQTATFTEEIINNGTVKTNPVITILFNSATSVTSIKFEILDNSITISETINASDVVVIDCDEKTVEINGILVDYSGTFPTLEVGTNSYTVTINGTKNFDTNISYFNNYL